MNGYKRYPVMTVPARTDNLQAKEKRVIVPALAALQRKRAGCEDPARLKVNRVVNGCIHPRLAPGVNGR